MKISDFIKSIDWNNVKKVHYTKDGKFYSFAVEIEAKKRIVTIGIAPDTTTMTISDTKGNVLAHTAQHGGELTVFSPNAAAI